MSNFVRSGYVPRTIISTPPLQPAPLQAPIIRNEPVRIQREPFISYYDPSRVVDLTRIKVVKDLRQSGTERGETQTGDNEILGPVNSESIAIPNGSKSSDETLEAKNNLVPIALAIAAFVLLGG